MMNSSVRKVAEDFGVSRGAVFKIMTARKLEKLHLTNGTEAEMRID